MSFENNYEKEKIRKTKRRLVRLHRKYHDIIDKLGYLRKVLKDYEKLSHRDTCPLCRGAISSTFYEKEIPKIKNNIGFLQAWIEQNYNHSKLCKIRKPTTELKAKEREAWVKKVKSYLNENRNKINKSIRTLDLPDDITTNNEKRLWNEAIQIQLDNKGMFENEDIEFEMLLT